MDECVLGKNYKESEPRTCLTVEKEKQEESRKEIKDSKEIERIILENVQQRFANCTTQRDAVLT